jgi:hypothetical protein
MKHDRRHSKQLTQLAIHPKEETQMSCHVSARAVVGLIKTWPPDVPKHNMDFQYTGLLIGHDIEYIGFVLSNTQSHLYHFQSVQINFLEWKNGKNKFPFLFLATGTASNKQCDCSLVKSLFLIVPSFLIFHH